MLLLTAHNVSGLRPGALERKSCRPLTGARAYPGCAAPQGPALSANGGIMTRSSAMVGVLLTYAGSPREWQQAGSRR